MNVKVYPIKNTELHASNMIMGNMRLTQLSLAEAENLIRTALEEGINFSTMRIYTDKAAARRILPTPSR